MRDLILPLAANDFDKNSMANVLGVENDPAVSKLN